MAAILGLVFVLNIYRASTQSITIDEAFTYNDFVAAPVSETLKHFDANNHVLNTILCKFSVSIFGVSELSLRLPSLLGGLLYLSSVLLLCRELIRPALLAVAAFALLVLNPMILDYLSAARGYSLALGLEYLAFYLLIRISALRHRRLWLATASVCFALSVASNLTFAIPNIAFLTGFVVTRSISLFDLSFLTLPGLVVFARVVSIPQLFSHASAFYIGLSSLREAVNLLLRRSVAFPRIVSDDGVVDFLYATAGYVVVAAILINIGYIFRNWRKSARNPAFLSTFTLVGSVGLILLLHRRLGLPFPYERTGLYLIPLATLNIVMAGLFIASSRHRRPIFCLWFGYLVVLLFQYGNEVKVDRYQEWDFDAGTKRVMTQLQRFI